MPADATAKILIVDDCPLMLDDVRELLAMSEYFNVAEAASARDALQVLQASGDFDLVISDFQMRDLTGLDLLRRMRSDAALARIPFIMMSGDSSDDTILAATRAGTSSYLVKPFSAAVLAQAIGAALAGR